MNTNKHDHHGFREVSRPHGPHGPHDRRRGGRPLKGSEGFGRRSHRRGDVRVVVLLLFTEEPMHGYQLMQIITEHTDGTWSPSPDVIYPTLDRFEGRGLVRIDTNGDHKRVSLTEVGRAHIGEHRPEWSNPLASEDGPRLREFMYSLNGAMCQVGRTGTDAQRQQIARELIDVRHRIYPILAGDEEWAGSL